MIVIEAGFEKLGVFWDPECAKRVAIEVLFYGAADFFRCIKVEKREIIRSNCLSPYSFIHVSNLNHTSGSK